MMLDKPGVEGRKK